jgi:hypothetical protein
MEKKMNQEIRDRALIVLNQYPHHVEENDQIRIDLKERRLQISYWSLRNLFSAFSQRQKLGFFAIEDMEGYGSLDAGCNKAIISINDAAQEIIEGRFAIKRNPGNRIDVPKN